MLPKMLAILAALVTLVLPKMLAILVALVTLVVHAIQMLIPGHATHAAHATRVTLARLKASKNKLQIPGSRYLVPTGKPASLFA